MPNGVSLLRGGPPLSRSPSHACCRWGLSGSERQRSGSGPRLRIYTTRSSWGGSAPRARRGGEAGRCPSRAPTAFGPSQGAVRRPACGASVGARPTFLAFFIGIADSHEWLLPKMRPAAHRIDRVGLFTGSERPNVSVSACQFGAVHESTGVGGESRAAPPRDRGP